MNRRKFLDRSAKGCAGAILAEQLMANQNLFAQTALMQALQQACNDKVLVLVQLFGGNDGLNTFIPLDQYSTMTSVRSNVTIAESNLKLATAVNANSTTLGTKSSITSKYADMAFHPAMEGAYNLFEANKMSIVMGCSYDRPDFSHFRGTDIWMMGADSNEFLKSGWIGRNLEEQYGEFGFPDPAELLNAGYPDPLCINMGSIAPLTLNASTGVGAGVSVTSITNDYPLLGGFGDLAPANCAGEELTFLRKVAIDTDKYNKRIVDAAKTVSDSTYAPSSLYKGNPSQGFGLASDLRKVAKLIKGGLSTRVYTVNMGGFDTHTGQVASGTPHQGTHANLLWQVSNAIAGFQDDLEKMGIADKVIGMVFTEFGRTVRSNGGAGTDHGRSTPVWFFGNSLKGGRYGTNPKLVNPNTNQVESQVPMQFDYRSTYYSVLRQWFGLNDQQMAGVFGGADKVAKYKAQEHDLIIDNRKATLCTSVTNTDDNKIVVNTETLSDAYPNPVEENALIPFHSEGGYVKLELYDATGHFKGVLLETDVPAGDHQYKFERNGLKSGMYVIKMRNNDKLGTKKLVLKE